MMVRYKLNQPLAAIATGDNLCVVAFNLVTWAERSGRVDELVAGAVKQMPRANGRFQLRRTYFANTTPAGSASTGNGCWALRAGEERQQQANCLLCPASLWPRILRLRSGSAAPTCPTSGLGYCCPTRRSGWRMSAQRLRSPGRRQRPWITEHAPSAAAPVRRLVRRLSRRFVQASLDRCETSRACASIIAWRNPSDLT